MIWKGVTLTGVTALCASCAAGGEARPRTPPIVIHVAVDGDDANDGTSRATAPAGHGPLRSLERARDVARHLRQGGGAAGGIEIAIGGGDYVLSRPLALGPEDSGTAAAPTLFRPEPGAHVRLLGGAPLQWRAGEDGELVADWRGACPQQMFVDGERRPRPRLPASGAFAIAAVDPRGPDGRSVVDHFTAGPGDLPTDFAPDSETEIVVIDAWTASRLRVSAYDARSGRLQLAGRFAGHGVHRDLTAGLPWYVENAPTKRLAPGQWRCDSQRALLRYRPLPGEAASSLVAIAPRAAGLLTIKGTRGRPVEHIAWQGIAFEYAAWSLPPDGWAAMQAEVGLPAAIEAADCRAVTFDRIAISHTGAGGLIIGRGCEDVKLSGSRLEDLGGSGVSIGSDQRKPVPGSDWAGGSTGRRETRRITVAGNDLRGLGRVQLAGVGIWVGQASHVTIADNRIADLFYSGISLGWVWSLEPNLSHDNLVTGNVIERFGQSMLSDFGGIYTLGRQDRTLIAGNRIRDGVARAYGGRGLYADEGSAGITFRDNLVERTSQAAVQVTYASEVSFVGNRFRETGEAALYCNRPSPGRSVQFLHNLHESAAALPATAGACGDPSYQITDLRLVRAGRSRRLDKAFGVEGRGPDYVKDSR